MLRSLVGSEMCIRDSGGAAALAGVMVLGAREGRFGKKGETKSLVPFAASSIPLVTLGTFFLWFGWMGFNGFSQLAMGTFDDVTAITKIAVNTHLAGAAGVVTGAVVTRLLDSKTDVVMMLNGALAGLVAITAAVSYTHLTLPTKRIV